MSQMRDRLYHLLPGIYRQRDEMAGQPLQALLAVIEKEFHILETDMAAAYDNWFIETCDAWVIPYLAELVGIEDLAAEETPHFGQRRLVANHIAYQRRKGLASILAHVLRDVTGWYAYVADLSQRVAQTQTMKNVKPAYGRTLDLRQGEQLALLGTAFDHTARTLDVRRVDADTQSGSLSGLGSFNALALYLWRLQSYPIRQAQAGVPARFRREKVTRHFTFDPLGRNLPLFIQPEAIDNLNVPMHPSNFPQPLTRAMLKTDLTQTGPRSDQLDFLIDEEQKSSRYYGPQKEIAIWIQGSLIPADKILCGEIGRTSDWVTLLRDLNKTLVVDPENGSFFLAQAVAPDQVTVNYTYGFSNELGSGPFWKSVPDAADELARQKVVRIDILKSSVDSDACKPIQTVSSLETALERWQKLCDESSDNEKGPPQAIIRFLDSGTYHLSEPLQPSLPSGCFLSIEASTGERPTIVLGEGSLKTQEDSHEDSKEEGVIFDRHLRLQGLLVRGPITLPEMYGGKLDFQIRGCTLLNSLKLRIPDIVSCELRISASMIDSIFVKIMRRGKTSNLHRKGSLMIEDSVVRRDLEMNLDPALGYVFETGIHRSTILGAARLAEISQIKDTILNGSLTVGKIEPDQVVMQYSYAARMNLAETNCAHCVTGSQTQPLFTSARPTHPGYAQLRVTCPKDIRSGASNGAEMGVFNALQVTRREANLKRILPDYLPLEQKIGLFTVT